MAAEQTLTATDGTFQLRPAEERHHYITMMETLGHVTYVLCVGQAGATSLPQYTASTTLYGMESGDQLECVRWQWKGVPQVSCEVESRDGPVFGPNAVRSFGEWMEGNRRGWYRIVSFVDESGEEPGQFVLQWLSSARGSGTARIVAMRELPVDPGVLDAGADFMQWDTGAGWVMRIPLRQRTYWGNLRWATFRLGAPGVIEQVDSPAS